MIAFDIAGKLGRKTQKERVKDTGKIRRVRIPQNQFTSVEKYPEKQVILSGFHAGKS